MITDHGWVAVNSTIRIPFSTFDRSGNAVTMTNFAAADVLIYKDGNTTERASASGITATTDFDNKTGRHLVVIDLSDNTTANFYAANSEYLVAIDSVTVDSQTVGFWLARFQIGVQPANATQWAGGIIPAPAQTGVPKVDLTYILGTILTETAGQLAAAFKKFFNIATPAATMDHLILVDTATTVTNQLSAATIAAAVWDSLTSTLTTVGSIGKWIVDKLDVVVSTRLASGSYTAPDNAGIAAIPTANQNADALLARNIAGGSSAGRLVKDALRFLRNKWTVSAGTLTVYQEDDSTTAWTAAVSTDANADPVIGNDPS